MLENWQVGGFGAYVHWPFCEAKCPYCDFNSHVVRKVDHARWAKAFRDDIRRQAKECEGRVLSSIFFGGGTPSLMQPETVAAVIDELRAHFQFANTIEITLEANPSSVEAGRFLGFVDAGVNRVSLGVQALNQRDLKRLGRLHDVDEALDALEIAQQHFDRVSFDLIYARQDQTLAQWEAELSYALSLGTSHLSLYQLTIEDGTRFGDLFERGKLLGLPNEDLSADMFEATYRLCEEAGFDAYEVSNFAQIGQESRHNLVYWRSGDFIGVGPGAHGRLSFGAHRMTTKATSNPSQWLVEVEAGKTAAREALTALDWATEVVMMGARIREPIDLVRLQELTGISLQSNAISELVGHRLIETDGSHLKVTPAGRPLVNSIVFQLVNGS